MVQKQKSQEAGLVRSLRLLRKSNKAIGLAKEEARLMEEICRLLAHNGGYLMAWVGLAEAGAGKKVRPVAWAGFEEDYLNNVTVTWDDTAAGRGPTGTAIRTGKPVVCQNIPTDPSYEHFREEATRRGYSSSVALPLTNGEGTFGALNIYAREPDAFGSRELEPLVVLADSLAHGITFLRMRSSLEKSEHRYRKIFQQASDAIALVDGQGNILDCNPSAYLQLGYEYEELLGKSLQDLAPPEDLDGRPLQSLRELEGKPFRFERKFRRKDGSLIDAEGSIVEFEKGTKLAILHDITERKQKDEEVRARNAELTALFELSTRMRAAKNRFDLLQISLEQICRLFGVEDGAVTLLSPRQKEFVFAHGAGVWEEYAGLAFPVSRGVSSRVLKTGKPYVTEDYSTDSSSLVLENNAQMQIGPMAVVPLKSEEGLIGVLALARRHDARPGPFSRTETSLLGATGEMVGHALRRIALYEEAQQRLRRTQALRTIDMAIAGSLDLRVTYRVALDEIVKQLEIDAASILRLKPHSRMLEYAAGRGFRFRQIKKTSLRLGEGHAGQAAQERRSVYIPDLSLSENKSSRAELLADEDFVSYYAVPMVAKGRLLGVVEVFHRSVHDGDAEWLEFLETLAGQVAIAIDNASLFNELEFKHTELLEAYDATIEGWGRALSLKEEETEEHSQRVVELTVQIARAMKMSDEEVTQAWRGAFLHDIGKIGIPDSILLKPGKLTDDEWAIMRQHPVYAFEMLSPIPYLRQAIEIPYCHHEKWDGTGYPRGLKGNQIPLAARIFAVVDVWDALSSDRPYRKAWPEAKVRAHIKKQAGSHFDPKVVDTFLQLTAGLKKVL